MRMLSRILIISAFIMFGASASAQEDAAKYPSRPIHIVVGFTPGGGNDILARIVGQKLSESLGQPVVIDNKPGGGAIVATEYVAKAAPDGYTVLHDATAFSVNAGLYSNLPFDYDRDFDPVALVSLVPNILVVTPSLPVKTVADVIAYAKAQPNGIDMASSGNGTLQHLSLEMFRSMTGAKVNHVPYRGGGNALTDVIAGQVKFFFSNGSSVAGLIQSGQLKAVAHTGKGRLKSLPDVPPASDTLPGFEAYEWNGVFVPDGTPPDIVRKLNGAVNDAISSADVKQRFEQLNIDTRTTTPEEFAAFVKDQTERWSKVVKDANIKLG